MERRKIDAPELGGDRERTLLRHDQYFAVGVLEGAAGHRPVDRVKMHSDPAALRDIAIAAIADEAIDEVGRLLGQRQRIPAQPIGRGRQFVERT